jgi:hypothetical protein
MQRILLFVVVCFLSVSAGAQSKTVLLKDRTLIYFSVGTERVFYTPSSIRFVSEKGQPSFDFTLEKARAHDEGGLEFKSDAPQYSYNLGYYSPRKKFGLEFEFDHIKYIMRSNQVVRLKGTINGQHYDKDTLVGPDFVQFEHTDGANYAMLSFVKQKTLASSRNQKNFLELVLKAGAGPVIPKTNSTIMGGKFDDEYAISGYVIGIEPGLRYNLFKYAFVTGSFKGAYANYQHFVILNGHGNQKWVSGQFNLMVGVQVPL